MFDGFSLDPFSAFDDGFRPAELGVCECDVFQALMIALSVVMFDERFDLRFEITGQIVIL